jgi:uncharacterized protein
MLSPGMAKKVTIYLNEDTSAARDFLYKEIISFLYEHGVSGATLIRPEAGFGLHRHLHQAEGEGVVSEHLPVRIEFVETAEKVESVLPGLCDLVTDGLIEAHDTMVLKSVAGRERG